MDKPGRRTVGFCGQYVTVTFNGRKAEAIVDFLCVDLARGPDDFAKAVYDVVVVGKKPMMSLWQGEKQLYFGSCGYDLAYMLINEIIYQSIVDNRDGFAIHAAAVGNGDGAMLLPGKSGSGKSTLVTWLISRGCNYLTDELVVISKDDRRVLPFTRPITIKTGSKAIMSSFLTIDPEKVLEGERGMMVPHRLVNKRFSAFSPPLSGVLFPQYVPGVSPEITRLSGAEGCLNLMACYVNARNIRDHGINRMAALAREIPFYRLAYGGFEGLEALLSRYFPQLFLPCFS